MSTFSRLTRRQFLPLTGAAIALPGALRADAYREIMWEDLIPVGVPYSEIIGPGQMNEASDYWKPQFDDNATKFNDSLDGADVSLPGYIIPLDLGSDGVTSFILVPYVGACIHVPPPPPNQLVFVTTEDPWPSEDLWDAVWVSGRMKIAMTSTEIAEIGYEISASKIELYEW